MADPGRFTPGDASSFFASTASSYTAYYNPALKTGATLGTTIPGGSGTLVDLDVPATGLEDRVGYKAGTIQWRERVENYSPWNDVFSMSQQEAELIVDVPFENRYLFLVYCLGYNYVDNSNRLRRINPIVHPYWNWLRCARVSHKGVRFEGKRFITAAGGAAGVAKYKLARFSLGFANYPWRFYDDSQITAPTTGQEIYRNTYYEFQPTTQFLQAEGGANTLKFPYAMTTNPAFNTDPPTSTNPYMEPAIYNPGTSFRAAMGTPVNQLRFKLHWKWVPYDFLFKGFVPINLINAMGTLNVASFLGDPNMPQGTLRCDAPEISTFVSPIRTGSTPELLCDVTLNFVHFDPPRLFIRSEDERTSPLQWVHPELVNIRGHNLVPDRLTGLWKPGTRGGVTPTLYNQMLQYSDFYNIFRKPS